MGYWDIRSRLFIFLYHHPLYRFVYDTYSRIYLFSLGEHIGGSDLGFGFCLISLVQFIFMLMLLEKLF